MNFNEFNQWLIKNYGFDAYENTFFEKALHNAYQEFEKTKINGVALPVLYKDTLFQKFAIHYKSYLTLLLKQIPPQTSSLILNIEGICLNDLRPFEQELQQKILLLNV